jgi:malonyl-CoA/methylmalonyl-CoA synthetase
MSHNLYQRIQDALLAAPEREILTLLDGRAIRAAELDQQVAHAACVLQGAGVEPGDRVSVQIDKSWMNVVLYLAVLRVGGVYLPLNTAYTDSEIEYFLTDAEPKVHVCAESRRTHAESLRSEVDGLQVFVLGDETGSFYEAYLHAREAQGRDDYAWQFKFKRQHVDRGLGLQRIGYAVACAAFISCAWAICGAQLGARQWRGCGVIAKVRSRLSP